MNRDDNLCWYHRSLTREDAEDLLKESGQDGIFLVRDSNTSPGDYVLSVLHKNEVFHYQIRRHGEDAFFSIDDQTLVHGLDSLIEHYRESSDGLVTQLSAIIVKDPPPAESRRHGVTNLLHRATKKGNLLIVEQMLMSEKNTYRLDAKDQDGRSAVHLACLLDSNLAEPILEKLINSGAMVNCRDEEGNTPLHYACRTKSLSLITLLIDAHAYIDARNNDTGRVPLHEAASAGNFDVVKLLLSLGVPHLPRSINSETPAQLARAAGHITTAEYLENYQPPQPTTQSFQWYHGTLSRDESGRILRLHVKENLQNEDAMGTFLIRYSHREKRNILGLLVEDNELKNYVIQESDNYFFIDEGPYMLSLEHLVQHYMRFSDGLPTKLRHPVPPKPKPPLPPTQAQDLTLKKHKLVKPAISRPSADEGSITVELNKECKLSKELEAVTPPLQKERNLSLPSDDLMNQVGLSSPVKTFLGSFLSLRKTKTKFSKESVDNTSNVGINNDISRAFSTLSFKPNISSTINQKQEINDPFLTYSFPKNIPVTPSEDVTKLNNMSSIATLPMPTRLKSNQNKNNNVDDLEKFTQSDKQIVAADELQDKDNSIEEIYFVEAEKIMLIPSSSINYVAFNQIPYFPTSQCDSIGHVLDNSLDNASYMNEHSKVNNNKISTTAISPSRSEKTLSIDSTFSNDLALMLQNQTNGNSNSPNYYIPGTCITLDVVLGQGEFGNVWKGHMRYESQNGEQIKIPVAIKTLHDEHCKENRIELLREASVMIKLSHHCIVNIIGISKGPPLMIVQELVSLGSLLEYLLTNSDKINPNSELKIWASQIACGMNYLERQHFVHRDLAARNILLSSIYQVKISDFGLSRALCAGDNYYKTCRGGKWPIKWYAPESFNYGTFSHASDVWSFGVTLWEMFSFGQTPYGDMKGVDVIKMVEQGGRLSRPPACPENVFEIMSSCWNYEAKHRPTFRYLTEFFSNDPDYQNLVELIRTQNIC